MFGLMKWKKEQPAAQVNDGELRSVKQSRDEWKAAADHFNGMFKAAISDLAAAREEIESLRPDAEAMRAKRQRDRNQKAAKRAVK